jgi:hypothetical protein
MKKIGVRRVALKVAASHVAKQLLATEHRNMQCRVSDVVGGS